MNVKDPVVEMTELLVLYRAKYKSVPKDLMPLTRRALKGDEGSIVELCTELSALIDAKIVDEAVSAKEKT